MSGRFLSLLCVKLRFVKESWRNCVEYMDRVILFVVLHTHLPHWVFSRVLLLHWAGLGWLGLLFR